MLRHPTCILLRTHVERQSVASVIKAPALLPESICKGNLFGNLLHNHGGSVEKSAVSIAILE